MIDKKQFVKKSFRTVKPNNDTMITVGKLKKDPNGSTHTQRICRRK